MSLSKELKRKSLSVDEKIEAILAVDKGQKKREYCSTTWNTAEHAVNLD